MTSPARRPSVLLVDADEDTLELVGEYLTARGMKVHTAYAADEAVALVRTARVDAVMTEVGTGSSGLELVRAARARAMPAGVVATLVGGRVELAVSTMRAGASNVLLKPFRLRDVYDALKDALARRKGELDARHKAERLLLYEAAAHLADPSELSRLVGLLAQVARRACDASEVAVWVPRDSGWTAVARGGRVAALEGVSPIELAGAGPHRDGSVAAVPLRDGKATLRAVLAVAGGGDRSERDLQELARLGRVVVDAIERVDRSPLTVD